MAQQVNNELAAKSDKPSLILRTHKVEESGSHKLPSDLHIHYDISAHAHTRTKSSKQANKTFSYELSSVPRSKQGRNKAILTNKKGILHTKYRGVG